MRSIMFACCTVFAGMAGAQVPTVASSAPVNASIVLDVPGGFYHSFLINTVDKPIAETVELRIEKRNAHPQWVPGSTLCVTAASSSHEACLRVSASGLSGDTLSVARMMFDKRDKRGPLSHDPVAGTFKMGDRIRIAVRAGPDSVEFKVGDGAWMMQALPFTPEAISLICSSAVCTMRLGEALNAP